MGMEDALATFHSFKDKYVAKLTALSQQLAVYRPFLTNTAADVEQSEGAPESGPEYIDFVEALKVHIPKLDAYPNHVVLPVTVAFFQEKIQERCFEMKIPLSEMASNGAGSKDAFHWKVKAVVALENPAAEIDVTPWKQIRTQVAPCKELMRMFEELKKIFAVWSALFHKYGPIYIILYLYIYYFIY